MKDRSLVKEFFSENTNSEYILQCREGIWYSYVDRNMGKALFVNALLKEFDSE